MPDVKLLTATSDIRLDLLLVEEWSHLGREQISDMLSNGQIHINDRPGRKVAQELHAGDVVRVRHPIPQQPQSSVSNVAIPLLFEDDQIVVIDKPVGLSLKISKRKRSASVAGSLAVQRPQLANVGGVGHSGIITPLEQQASGLVLVAKDDVTYRELRRHLKRQRIHYTFTAMVEGRLRGDDVIEEPIGNARHERERLQVSREGRPAITAFRAQRHFKDEGQDYTLLALKPTTSRRHQIRVHLSWYGFPIVGDKLYGSRHQNLLPDRLFLHLGVLEFPHPNSGKIVRVESALPLELQSILTFFVRPKL